MNTIAAITGAPWAQTVAPAVLLCGLVAIWRGLLGGRDRARGLLMRHIGMRERIEGFRLLVFGLVLLGVAGAVLWQQEWLLILALGIGFVEILESSALIAFWNRGQRGRWAGGSRQEPIADSR